MMDVIYNFLKKDLQAYEYMLKKDDEKRYIFFRMLCLLIGGIVGIIISLCWISSWYLRFLCFASCVLLVYKIPYMLLKMDHNKRCSKMQDAVIIWV